MHLVIQLWTPAMAFFEASPLKRAEALGEIHRAIEALPGVESLGWGAIDASAPNSTGRTWMAAWRVDGEQPGDALLAALQAAGWFHWFDATSVRTELAPSVNAEEALIAIPHIEGTL